jgi:1,4-dihydroxy-2-naphthoyl-CoA synthase
LWFAWQFLLVNEVMPHDTFLDEAFVLAHKIVEKSPLAIAACLGSVTRGINVPIDEGLVTGVLAGGGTYCVFQLQKLPSVRAVSMHC